MHLQMQQKEALFPYLPKSLSFRLLFQGSLQDTREGCVQVRQLGELAGVRVHQRTYYEVLGLQSRLCQFKKIWRILQPH